MERINLLLYYPDIILLQPSKAAKNILSIPQGAIITYGNGIYQRAHGLALPNITASYTLLDHTTRMKLPDTIAPVLRQLNIYLFEGYSYDCQRHWNIAGAVPKALQTGCTGQTAMLPVEKIIQVVQEGLALGMRSVRLTGIPASGDPLLYSHFDTLLEQLEASGTTVKVETSGTGMTPARASKLGQYTNCEVRMVLAGADAATHDALTGIPGNYRAVVSAARMLSEEGTALNIIFPVVRRNSGQVSRVIRQAEQLGAASLLLIAVSPFHNLKANGAGLNGSNKAIEPLTVEELIALGRKVERQYQAQTRVKLLFDQPPAFRGLHPSARLEGQSTCDVTYSLSLLPDGMYTLCGMALYGGCVDEPDSCGLILGNAGDTRLAEIWQSHPLLAALRSGMSDRLSGVCEHCLVKSACLGRCPIENLQRTGSFWGPYWFCEAAERAGLFPAGRLVNNYW